MKSLAAGALLLLMASSTSSAQQPNLFGGTWIHKQTDADYNNPGNLITTTMFAQFSPGRLAVQTAISSKLGFARYLVVYQFQLTSESSYALVAVDYSPKQTCGAGGFCGPQQPIVPMGTRASCEFRFEGELFVHISCDGAPEIQFTRH